MVEGLHHFKLLGVPVNATKEEIKKAYRLKARDCHPDRNPSEEAHELFIKLKEAYDFLAEGDKGVTVDQDTERSNKLRRDYEEKKKEAKKRSSRFSDKPSGGSPSGSNSGLIRLKLNWNTNRSKFTVKHLKRSLSAFMVEESGAINCTNGSVIAHFANEEDALSAHQKCCEMKPSAIKVTWISDMPKIAKDLLKHIEDSEDECIIIEPKKKKSKKEKTKYDRGYYKDIHDQEMREEERRKRERDIERQWSSRARANP